MRKYIIVPAEKIDLVHFHEVHQTSPDTLRYSLDGKFFILKYTGDQPKFCYEITEDLIGLEEYSHQEILNILGTSEWTSQD